MTQAMFQELVQQLSSYLECQTTTMCPPLPIETQVAITLFKLTTSASLCYVGHLFGVDKPIAREAVLEVCGAVQDILAHIVLQVADPLEVAVGF